MYRASEEYKEFLKSWLESAKKKKLTYTLFDEKSIPQSEIDSVKTYNGLLKWLKHCKGPFSLISFGLLDRFIKSNVIGMDTVWKTQFANVVEESFTFNDRFKSLQDKQEKVLVVGSLGEFYVSRV